MWILMVFIYKISLFLQFLNHTNTWAHKRFIIGSISKWLVLNLHPSLYHSLYIIIIKIYYFAEALPAFFTCHSIIYQIWYLHHFFQFELTYVTVILFLNIPVCASKILLITAFVIHLYIIILFHFLIYSSF